ncbi:50S ribosomal protein L3 [Candidatus Beckwithbacteria bacterium RBG_13_42_9]|uniref:50S ribosomal protein L3 n=1 Tax=Candidatus Beckwithbacteria bacterium RBG_13_42_9 TaxID=1797457 RepID=A0A1F5E8U6_9BACT|nr:MAG: 50S ribosomal protein L3 [Candidatus Beckwithbacteria bacterium RBG_13_42_9]
MQKGLVKEAFLLKKGKMRNFYGFKKQPTQIFDNQGKRLVITKVSAQPLVVIGFKTQEKNGYQALKVALGQKKRINKPIKGALGKLELKPRFIRELKTDDLSQYSVGSQVLANTVFQAGDRVKVEGISKGKGFAGVVKRWGFAGGPKTHGQSDRPRAPGSIGQGTSPGRIWKGKKMAGQMGNVRQTVLKLQVVKIDEENQEIWVKGLIPGFIGSLVKITKTGEGRFVGLPGEKADNQEKVEEVEKSSEKIEEKEKAEEKGEVTETESKVEQK